MDIHHIEKHALWSFLSWDLETSLVLIYNLDYKHEWIVAVFQLLYSFSLKGASALTDAWLGRPQTFCTQFTWGQQTWEVGWIPGVPFRTRCGPREATGVPWLSQCSCSSWTWKQGSPGPLLQSVMGVFFTLLWSLQWHVPVLLWRNWSEQSCIPFCWHMCLWTRGQSSLDYGLIIDFYECGSNFTKMFFVNVSSVRTFPFTFLFPPPTPLPYDLTGEQRPALVTMSPFMHALGLPRWH